MSEASPSENRVTPEKIPAESSRTNTSMICYRLSKYTSFLENQLIPGSVRYAVAHRLTGEMWEIDERVYALLQGVKTGNPIGFSDEQLNQLGPVGFQLRQVIQKNILNVDGRDEMSLVINHFVSRPIQNPAITYKNTNGETILVRTSLAQQVYAPRMGELPQVVEEKLPATAQSILQLATGDRTLAEVFKHLQPGENIGPLADEDFRAAIDWLTAQERQLIKFTNNREDLLEPYRAVNTIPRTLFHAHRWQETPAAGPPKSIIDFHLRGIEDAWWEFDQIEATVNHALRFPDEMLEGLDYGSRFCMATLTPNVLSVSPNKKSLEVLEVGAGTGTFARSFLTQARALRESNQLPYQLNYHILDLAPELIANQKKLLSELLPKDSHFQQDATEFTLARRFDLILSNEVVADFPVAPVHRRSSETENQNDSDWEGDGLPYLEKYELTTKDAPDNFLINAGAMKFIERCWEHLNPGGTVVLSEYGSSSRYPDQAYHLNHEEFSIQFSHLAECGTKLGFSCRLLTLREYLELNVEVPVFAGREEHILCLNHVLQQHGATVPYAIISQTAFQKRFQPLIDQLEIDGIAFLELKKGFYFGPRIEEFMVLIMNKQT